MALIPSKTQPTAAPSKPLEAPPAAKPSAPSLVERFDCGYQATVQIQTKTFIANAVIGLSDFRILGLTRRSGGEPWPMHGGESLEYSAMVAQLAASAPAVSAKLRGLR